MISGQKLRDFRELHAVGPAELAGKMGVARQRIPQIEGQAEVGREVAERYLTALVRCVHVDPPEIELKTTMTVGGQEFATW